MPCNQPNQVVGRFTNDIVLPERITLQSDEELWAPVWSGCGCLVTCWSGPFYRRHTKGGRLSWPWIWSNWRKIKGHWLIPVYLEDRSVWLCVYVTDNHISAEWSTVLKTCHSQGIVRDRSRKCWGFYEESGKVMVMGYGSFNIALVELQDLDQ